VYTGFCWGCLGERDHLENPDVDRWEDNIKMNFSEVGYGSMDWIDLAQNRDRWRALVNAAVNLRVP
jgi:hypothetical protein